MNPITLDGNHIYAFFRVSLSAETIKHTRQIYSLLDLFGDFGGLLEVLTIIFSLAVSPWSQFHFEMKAIQKLYMVHTKNKGVFEETKSEKHLKRKKKLLAAVDPRNRAQLDRVKNMRHAKLSFCK